MRGAIAAGHPLSAEAGARVLRDGGNAVDALLAAAFTAFVTEGPLTGPAGGGFLLVHEPGSPPIVLDCFFAVPEFRLGVMEEVVVDFADAGTQVFHIGEGSVAVPGLVAGLEEAHRRFATARWESLVELALELVDEGVVSDAPRAFLHEILGGILLRNEGGRRIYGDAARTVTAELRATLEQVRDLGSAAVADLLPEYTRDLEAYEVVERVPLETTLREHSVFTPPPPSRGGEIIVSILERLGAAVEPCEEELAAALGEAYGVSAAGKLTGTTHISVVDESGRAAALSSTLGSGSGVFRGGTQLNNMLGELDVIGHEPRAAGTRLPSMLAPTLILRDGRPRLILGSAGSVRLAGAIAQVAWHVVGRSATVEEAIAAPRLHVEGETLHVEGGRSPETTALLAQRWNVMPWAGRNLYFGGVQAVELDPAGQLAAAGDPRRGGAGVVVG